MDQLLETLFIFSLVLRLGHLPQIDSVRRQRNPIYQVAAAR